jgi:hypothetical protein
LDLAGTNPIHNKKPKKAKVEDDEDTKAFKAKQQAGKLSDHSLKLALMVSHR